MPVLRFSVRRFAGLRAASDRVIVPAGVVLLALAAAGCEFGSQGGGGPAPGLSPWCLRVIIDFVPDVGGIVGGPPGADRLSEEACEQEAATEGVQWTIRAADGTALEVEPSSTWLREEEEDTFCRTRAILFSSDFLQLGLGEGATFEVEHELGDWSVLCDEMLIEACPSDDNTVQSGRSLSWRGADTCLQQAPSD